MLYLNCYDLKQCVGLLVQFMYNCDTMVSHTSSEGECVNRIHYILEQVQDPETFIKNNLFCQTVSVEYKPGNNINLL